jgi:hypothetical protein
MQDFEFRPVEAEIPIEEGTVQFKVEKVEQDTVKSEGDNFGAQMMVVSLLLRDRKGNTKRIKQYFVLKDEYIRNLAYFCQAAGIYEKYKTGKLSPADMVGQNGKCEIRRQDKTIEDREVKVIEIVKFIKKENKATA